MIVLRKELTSRCSGLNFSVSLALMEAATLPSSPAMVNLGSRYSGSGAYGQQYLTQSVLLTCSLSSNGRAYQTCSASQRLPSSKVLLSENIFGAGAVCFGPRRCPQHSHCLQAKTTVVRLCGASREQQK